MECSAAPLSERERLAGGIERTQVCIADQETAERLGRPMGTYVTLSCAQDRSIALPTRQALTDALAREIGAMLPENAHVILVAGLGNRNVTPDALGPKTADQVLVTRHLSGVVGEEVLSGMRCVCAASPGVLGMTGVETAEVVGGVVRSVRPDAVIAVDALAARSSERICSTIQIADTGIAPGSGVGNHRRALNRETLGVPVIAVGVPMVVYAASIASDALCAMARADGASPEDEEKLEHLARRVVSEQLGDLIVTPREIDALIGRMAGILADGINRALHPGLSPSDIGQLMAT